MMTLTERIQFFTELFDDVMSTNSMLLKRTYVLSIPGELQEDFDYILEVLAGQHPFGYKYEPTAYYDEDMPEDYTIKQVLVYLQEPMLNRDLSQHNIFMHTRRIAKHCAFFEPIINRTLRLGIGRSLLQKDMLSAMLAKKYEGNVRNNDIFVTEKLDGNRCIAHFDGIEWQFTSRNGKPMHVKFDMTGLPKNLTYDGEVLSPEQTQLSMKIADGVFDTKFDKMFNETSGLINRHSLDKKLIYNIFDVIVEDETYANRREILSTLVPQGNVRILPVLRHYSTKEARDGNIDWLLDKVVSAGGEGLMINIADGLYEHKRTDSLLKYKQVQTMDMEVVGIEEGEGKYEGLIGAINVRCVTDKGDTVYCNVGSGLSDTQRFEWAFHPEKILGKIVEVAYFSVSQNANHSAHEYSLRFPRLKSVREDKTQTSQF